MTTRHKITLTLVIIVLFVSSCFFALTTLFFYEDSKTLLSVQNEAEPQLKLINSVLINKKEFTLSNETTCDMFFRVVGDLANDHMFPSYMPAKLDIKKDGEKTAEVVMTIEGGKQVATPDSWTIQDNEKGYSLYRVAQTGETTLITIVKADGFTTLFSTSVQNSIATQSVGRCKAIN